MGKSMAMELLRLGAQVAITSRKLEVLKETARTMESETGGKVLPVACDVRHPEQVEAMVNQVQEEFGLPHGVINNAAGNFISPTERLSPKAFQTIIDIVLMGTIHVTLDLGKRWLNAGSKGTVLNIATTYANTGSGYVVPSACAKAGVVALTKSLAVEWGSRGIRMNAVAPGPFPTKGAWDRLLPGDLKEKLDMTKRVPLRRVGEHQELANLCAFLMSDFSAYINGEVITIDGGEWLQGAGQFNMLHQVPNAMWDALEQMIRSTKGS